MKKLLSAKDLKVGKLYSCSIYENDPLKFIRIDNSGDPVFKPLLGNDTTWGLNDKGEACFFDGVIFSNYTKPKIKKNEKVN